MFLVKGTDKIKGVLDIGKNKKQIAKNEELFISDEQFYDNTTQIAIKMGYLTFESVNSGDSKNRTVELTNIYDRTITLNMVSGDILPYMNFTILEDNLHHPDIKAALAKGMIKLTSSVHTRHVPEATVNVGNMLEDVSTVESEGMDTNEEISISESIDENETSQSMTKNDPKGESVVWNPNREPVARTATSTKAVSRFDEKLAFVDKDTKIKKDDDGILFADKKIELERIMAHPVLKNKMQNNTDVQFTES